MAAQHLNRAGIDVTVVDKGNRPGGRMATRPFEGAVFDYGAQFFTVRSERFASFQRDWETKGLVSVWNTSTHPRYIGPHGMNSIPTHLAQGIKLRCGVKVSQIFESGGQWNLEIDLDEVMQADALIVTCPVPQALALFGFEIPALRQIEFDRCLALMAILESPLELPESGAKQLVDGEPIAWIADNQRKGISAIANSLTMHAGPKFSLENWEKNAEEVAHKMLDGCKASAWKLHRWKYSKPSVLHEERCFAVNATRPLVIAGDAFGEARVEGAALSGLSAAERLLELL